MANILASQSVEMRAKGEALIKQADRLLCESWNDRMWSDGESPLPTTGKRRTAQKEPRKALKRGTAP
jgi:hypothetical protein